MDLLEQLIKNIPAYRARKEIINISENSKPGELKILDKLLNQIEKAENHLTAEELKILEEYYYNRKTFKHIGQEMGYTRATISRKRNKALDIYNKYVDLSLVEYLGYNFT